MEKKYIITEEILKRYELMNQVLEGFITLRQAQETLGLSYRQALRIKKRFITYGFEGLLRKRPEIPQALKISSSVKEEIIKLRRSIYWDFNILHFKEKLKEDHGIDLSYESVRKILLEGGLYEPRRKKKFHRRRMRMPKAGILVQMDSSQHRWIDSIQEPWWLVAMTDDADGFVYAEFHSSETVRANMEVIRAYIEKRGLFMALYTDKASHFRTTRHGGLHYEVEVEQKETQIERALKELGIKLINANSPQAKGKIERKFRFFQDRLIKEMRLRGIKDYDEANRFLKEEFLPWCNNRYSCCVESIYMPVPSTKDLDLVFSIKHPRKVNKDNTVRYNGGIYQILPINGIKSLANEWVEMCEIRDGRLDILWKGKRVSYSKINGLEDKTRLKEKEQILNLRTNTVELKESKKSTPPANHPWRKSWKKNVTFSHSNKM